MRIPRFVRVKLNWLLELELASTGLIRNAGPVRNKKGSKQKGIWNDHIH